MKKRKMVKKAAIIALSSVLAAGSLTALAGCGGGNSAQELSVMIFCNASDKEVNEEIMNKWAAQYSADHPELGFEIGIAFDPYTKKEEYFSKLKEHAKTGARGIADIIYLSPKYVKTYSQLGYVMDLTNYLESDAKTALSGVWSNAVSYYGYDKTDDYTFGQSIGYDATKDKFVTTDGNKEVGLYGLPKDYSNFSLGFNKQYFSEELVKAYQEELPSQTRSIKNPSRKNTNLATEYYTGGKAVAKYAVSGTYNIYDVNGNVLRTETVEKGQEAPILSIGIPVTYTPFNFYLYNSYEEAKNAGDPIACLVEGLSDAQGFTVTIPGLPGWTFDIDDATGYSDHNSDAYKHAVKENAAYDSSIGHMTLTYQEYGALSWAMTYFLNTFNWENNADGYGGRTVQEDSNTVHYGIYGGEQYERDQGNAMYLLPWLAASDADFVNEKATTMLNPNGVKTLAELESDAYKNQNATAFAGDASEQRTKVNLDGSSRTVDVQYGMNSQTFLKVYSAYANHGAVWNANSGGAKDGQPDDDNSGWNYFRQGRSIFYGAGSWDAATRNDSDPAYFSFGQMPTPVAEEYALYSTVASPDYTNSMVRYYNANNEKATGANAHKSDAEQASSAPTGGFLAADIYRNQILRQDKWAARMDSVGYAANGRFATLSEDDPEAWKAKAAASLIAALTVQEAEQVTLTYAGAQLPNFVQQCDDFLNYNVSGYENGAFKDMLTPDGFADNTSYGTGDDIGRKIWDYYYTVVQAMAKDSFDTTKNSQTVSQWIAANGYGDYKEGEEKGDPNKSLRYDPAFADVPLSTFVGESSNHYYSAMRALRMVNFSRADRDLNIRMQTGLNAVRDSTMYTPDTSWLNGLNAGVDANIMLTYAATLYSVGDKAAALMDVTPAAIGRTYATANQDVEGHAQWWSPAMYATVKTFACESELQRLIREEKASLQFVQ